MHLTRDELVQWRDRPAAADRDRVVSHLAVCDACAALYASLMPDAPIEAGPYVERGRTVYAEVNTGSLPLGRAARLALAATLVAAIGATVWLTPSRDSVTRGGGDADVILMEPTGAGPAPALFRWSGAPGEARLLVVSVDRGGVPVIDRQVTGSVYALTDDERAAFLRGTYRWLLEYRDRAGQTQQSAAELFIVQ